MAQSDSLPTIQRQLIRVFLEDNLVYKHWEFPAAGNFYRDGKYPAWISPWQYFHGVTVATIVSVDEEKLREFVMERKSISSRRVDHAPITS